MKESTSDRLKQIMRERNLKQVDILKLSIPHQKELGIKMSKSTLSQYVNGVQSPDQDRLYLLSKTLNVSEPWLMGYSVDRERVPDDERGSNLNDKTPEFFAIQRKSKRLTQEQQRRLLRIMEATFEKMDSYDVKDDGSDDYL